MTYRERDILGDLRVKLQRLRNGAPLEDSLGLYIFMGLRSHLEKYSLNDRFPYVKFYADWMVHPKLDRNSTGRKIVTDIIEALKNNQIAPEHKTLEINRKLGLAVLRNEMNTFFTENDLDKIFLEDPHWQAFFGQIARLVTAKPIDLDGRPDALCRANEISEVDYDSYPVFWLFSEPGARIDAYVACVRVGETFSEDLIARHEENGTMIFQSGLYWDAV
jgi:hypothetical protein